MKKTLVIILVTVLGVSGFLYYDWHTKTKMQSAEPSMPQYAWTDAQGSRHFTDSPPPKVAINIKKTNGMMEYWVHSCSTWLNNNAA